MHKLGFANGCFDGLHPGHLYFLQQAKMQCEQLIIGLNRDESVRQMKGKGRPLLDFQKRKRALLASGYVDDVYAIYMTPKRMISLLRPDVVFRGWDQKLDVQDIPVIRIPRFQTYSTTSIANGLHHRQ